MPSYLHELLDRPCAHHPDACAIDSPPGAGHPDRRRVTYADLARLSNSIAAQIQPRIVPESIVAIVMRRNSELIYASQLAVNKAGAAFVCIDPSFPDGHIGAILADASPVAMLVDGECNHRLEALKLGSDLLQVSCDLPPTSPVETPDWLKPSDLAYLIYTSGTTGAPKGVMIEHRSVVNLVEHDIPELGLGPGDRVGQSSSASYDSSIEETWMALATGATLIVMDDDTVRLGPDLIPWLRNERINVFCPPPTQLRTTGCSNPAQALPDLRIVYVGGEALTPDIADLWSPGRRMINGYGPTECTVTVSHTDIHPRQDITIGKPIPGFSAWILDERLDEAALGAHGELCIGGMGLARGYYKRPDLTAEKFIEHQQFGRIYRTGDLASINAEGDILFHGRIDAQVKVRGYRIELEAIEACLAAQEGVRAAACRVQGVAGRQELAAFVVPINPDSPPCFEELKRGIAARLPAYMVPSRFAARQQLPTTVSGKLDRNALPVIGATELADARPHKPPHTQAESAVAAVVQTVLGLPELPSIDADFFSDLGGSSLTAAQLVSLLRMDSETALVTVRDVYDHRTIEALAGGIAGIRSAVVSIMDESPQTRTESHPQSRDRVNPFRTTVLQITWLLAELLLGSAAAATIFTSVLGWIPETLSPAILILAWWLLAGVSLVVYAPLSVLLAVIAKRALIGEYTTGIEPIWGSFYVRHWIVLNVVRLIPWRLIEGTEFACMALRALGARIGKRVHIHRGAVPLNGGWDLLEIGDDATLARDASVRVVELESGCLIMGAITIGAGATLAVRAGAAPNTTIGEGAYITALSSVATGTVVSPGERWDGIPARYAGDAPAPPATDTGSLTGRQYSLALIALRSSVQGFTSIPIVAFAALGLSQTEIPVAHLLTGRQAEVALAIAAACAVAALPFTLAVEAIAVRLLGKAREGSISVWSGQYIRILIKSEILESAGRWLSGTLFWPIWLRASGMRVGSDCEISTIMDVVPELVEIGPSTFFADGIYLGPPEIHRGVATIARMSTSRNTFVGNHAVIPAGQTLPEDILIGISTVADDKLIRPGSSWFGLPPFELPRREVVECDRSLTHNPSPIRYWSRVFWELLRILVPAVPACAGVAWLMIVGAAAVDHSAPVVALVYGPLATLALSGLLCALTLAMKWMLLGRVKPGTHPLWSCWCSRWDFLYVIWTEWGLPALSRFEGTLMLNVYLRGMGMKIGRRVALSDGFAQVVDPDMIEIGDDATVSAMIQAHTFEDRVLKIDRIVIAPGASLGHATVPLYGANVGDGAVVAPHSVVMKHEVLLPGVRYEGAPSKPVQTGTSLDSRLRGNDGLPAESAVVRTMPHVENELLGTARRAIDAEPVIPAEAGIQNR